MGKPIISQLNITAYIHKNKQIQLYSLHTLIFGSLKGECCCHDATF